MSEWHKAMILKGLADDGVNQAKLNLTWAGPVPQSRILFGCGTFETPLVKGWGAGPKLPLLQLLRALGLAGLSHVEMARKHRRMGGALVHWQTCTDQMARSLSRAPLSLLQVRLSVIRLVPQPPPMGHSCGALSATFIECDH